MWVSKFEVTRVSEVSHAYSFVTQRDRVYCDRRCTLLEVPPHSRGFLWFSAAIVVWPLVSAGVAFGMARLSSESVPFSLSPNPPKDGV